MLKIIIGTKNKCLDWVNGTDTSADYSKFWNSFNFNITRHRSKGDILGLIGEEKTYKLIEDPDKDSIQSGWMLFVVNATEDSGKWLINEVYFGGIITSTPRTLTAKDSDGNPINLIDIKASSFWWEFGRLRLSESPFINQYADNIVKRIVRKYTDSSIVKLGTIDRPSEKVRMAKFNTERIPYTALNDIADLFYNWELSLKPAINSEISANILNITAPTTTVFSVTDGSQFSASNNIVVNDEVKQISNVSNNEITISSACSSIPALGSHCGLYAPDVSSVITSGTSSTVFIVTDATKFAAGETVVVNNEARIVDTVDTDTNTITLATALSSTPSLNDVCYLYNPNVSDFVTGPISSTVFTLDDATYFKAGDDVTINSEIVKIDRVDNNRIVLEMPLSSIPAENDDCVLPEFAGVKVHFREKTTSSLPFTLDQDMLYNLGPNNSEIKDDLTEIKNVIRLPFYEEVHREPETTYQITTTNPIELNSRFTLSGTPVNAETSILVIDDFTTGYKVDELLEKDKNNPALDDDETDLWVPEDGYIIFGTYNYVDGMHLLSGESNIATYGEVGLINDPEYVLFEPVNLTSLRMKELTVDTIGDAIACAYYDNSTITSQIQASPTPTTTVFTVADAGKFQADDLVTINGETREILSISTNQITLISGLSGSPVAGDYCELYAFTKSRVIFGLEFQNDNDTGKLLVVENGESTQLIDDLSADREYDESTYTIRNHCIIHESWTTDDICSNITTGTSETVFDVADYTKFAVGDNVIVNGESRSISGISTNTITLSTALSSIPNEGDICYLDNVLPLDDTEGFVADDIVDVYVNGNTNTPIESKVASVSSSKVTLTSSLGAIASNIRIKTKPKALLQINGGSYGTVSGREWTTLAEKQNTFQTEVDQPVDMGLCVVLQKTLVGTIKEFNAKHYPPVEVLVDGELITCSTVDDSAELDIDCFLVKENGRHRIEFPETKETWGSGKKLEVKYNEKRKQELIDYNEESIEAVAQKRGNPVQEGDSIETWLKKGGLIAEKEDLLPNVLTTNEAKEILKSITEERGKEKISISLKNLWSNQYGLINPGQHLSVDLSLYNDIDEIIIDKVTQTFKAYVNNSAIWSMEIEANISDNISELLNKMSKAGKSIIDIVDEDSSLKKNNIQ